MRHTMNCPYYDESELNAVPADEPVGELCTSCEAACDHNAAAGADYEGEAELL